VQDEATTADPHALVGAYAVDALDADEARFFERHLAACSACAEEVASLRDAVGHLGVLAEEAPPASLRASVLDAVSRTSQLPPLVAPQAEPARSVRPRWAPLVGVAAAIVLLVGVGTVVLPGAPEEVDQVTAVMQAPDARTITLADAGGAPAGVLVHSPSHGAAAVVGHGIAPAPEGHAYVVWTLAGGEPRYIDLAAPDAQGTLEVMVHDVEGADMVALTVEPLDADHQAGPVGPVVYTAALG
jgi:anti-sigma-K factor RskA